jgi:hypothetical protein
MTVTLVRRLLCALWAGVLVSVGGLVAPTLFAILDSRLVAGRIAAELFVRTTILSCAIALALVFLSLAHRPPLPRWQRLLPLLPSTILAVNELTLRPLLEVARVTHGAASTAFAAWHGVSAALYVLATLAAVFLLTVELRRTP